MIVEKILNKLNEVGYSFKAETPRGTGLRGSAAGKCTRALAYNWHGAQGKPFNARTKLVFRLGDHCEEDVAFVAEALGVLTDRQKEVSIEIAGHQIVGHIDGLTKDDNGNLVLVDVKSINTMGFKRAVKDNDVGDYKYQLNFYMHILGLKQSIVLYYNKDTSHLAEVPVSYSPEIWQEIVDKFTKVIKSTVDNLPDRDYQPNDKGRLPYQCTYCEHCSTCWPGYELSFDNAGKPQLKINK